jgi:hypothetical protein
MHILNSPLSWKRISSTNKFIALGESKWKLGHFVIDHIPTKETLSDMNALGINPDQKQLHGLDGWAMYEVGGGLVYAHILGF